MVYINRFGIDGIEEVAYEFLKIYELEKRQRGQTRKEKAKDLPGRYLTFWMRSVNHLLKRSI